MKNYRCVTSVQEIQQYIGDAAVVAFDYETAPDEPCLLYTSPSPRDRG